MSIKEAYNPKSIKEVLEILDKYGDRAKIIAGGTDIVIQLRNDEINPEALIDIFKIEELRGIEEKDDEILIGACTTYTDVVESSLFDGNLKGFKRSCRLVGSPQIRNKGTIGGNIANGAAAADSVPPLMCLDARVVLESLNGKRELTLEEYYKDTVKPDELLTYIKFQKSKKDDGILAFSKLGLRKALAISRLTSSVYLERDNDGKIKLARVASGALGRTPIREKKVENYLLGKNINDETIEESINLLRESAAERLKGRSTLPYKSSALDTILREALEETL